MSWIQTLQVVRLRVSIEAPRQLSKGSLADIVIKETTHGLRPHCRTQRLSGACSSGRQSSQ